MQQIRSLLTALGVLTARPIAFLVFAVFAFSWFVFDRDTFDFHAVATLATWFMTLLIQRAEHRGTQAIHAKLDELIRAQTGARNEFKHVDSMEPEDIEAHRARLRTEK